MKESTQPAAGHALPARARVELDEASGPVSPRYQYDLRVVFTLDEQGASLSHHQEGDGVGDPDHRVDRDGPVPAAAARDAVARLVACGALTLGADLVGDEARKRTGVRANALVVTIDGVSSRLDYFRTTLSRPEHADRRRLVDLVKGLATQFDAATTPVAGPDGA